MQNLAGLTGFGPNPNHPANMFPPGISAQTMMQMMQNGGPNNTK